MTTTTADLKREYHQANLWRAGLSMQKAFASPLVRLGLEVAAKARTKGKSAPVQPALI